MVQPEGGKVVLGGTLTLTCETPAQSSLQIHWIKDVSDLVRGLGSRQTHHWQLGQEAHGEADKKLGKMTDYLRM